MVLIAFTAGVLAKDHSDRISELERRVEALEQKLLEEPRDTSSGLRETANSPSNGDVDDPLNAHLTDKQLAIKELADAIELAENGAPDEALLRIAEIRRRYPANLLPGLTSAIREIETIGVEVPGTWQSHVEWVQGEARLTKGLVLVFFWELWLPLSTQELERLQRLADQHKELHVVGLTRTTKGATQEKVASYLDEEGLSFPVAKEDGSLSSFLNVKGIPAGAILKDGRVVWRGNAVRLTDEWLSAG